MDDKLKEAIKLGQSYILLFIKEYASEDEIKAVQNIFDTCPVVIENIKDEVDQFGNVRKTGGEATADKITISTGKTGHISVDSEEALNMFLGDLIHEYAHKIRDIKHKHDKKWSTILEEGFATLFAEACINNARMYSNVNNDKIMTFNMRTSFRYQKYESHIRALLYVLKQYNDDKQNIYEFVVGDQDKFVEMCIQVFGEEFIKFYEELYESPSTSNSEALEIDMIVNLIKQKGLNIKGYYDNCGYNELYKNYSPILIKAISTAGKEYFTDAPEEFDIFDSTAKEEYKDEKIIEESNIDNIKSFIEENYSITGKSANQIHDILIDVGSAYYANVNINNNKDSVIFMLELRKFIPYIDDFVEKFRLLRKNFKDKEIFDNLDLSNVTYDDIYSTMNMLIEKINSEDIIR